ncbi:MAG: radical SAM protein, partial [Candidatus Thorarchaeota archaeon]
MKILFFVEGRKSLGHINRCIELAKSILKLESNNEIKFILDSDFTQPFKKNDFEFIRINPLDKDKGTYGGNLPAEYNQPIKEVLLKEKPDIIIFDTFFPYDILNDLELRKIRKILLLRKYKDNIMQIFLSNEFYKAFDLILVPNSREEFLNFENKFSKQLDSFKFIGSITKDVTGSIKKEKDNKKLKILALCGGGGFDDADKFINANLSIHSSIKNKIKNLDYCIITGPFYKNYKKLKKKEEGILKIKDYEEDIISLMQNADLIISQAGYNTINEIILTKTPAIIMSGYRNNDDQVERSLKLEKYGVAIVVNNYNIEKISGIVLDYYENKNKLDNVKKNFDKIKLDIGNEKATIEILDLLKEKKIRLKIGNKCNNNCVFCSSLNIKEKYERSLEEIKKELNNLKGKNYTEIVLPCNLDIRKDFFEILEYTKDLGLKITLETNGRMFYYRDFYNNLSKYIDKIIIYLNSNYPNINDKITNTNNSFTQAIQGIKNIKELKKEIQINTIITNYNYKNLKEIVSLVKELGVREFRLIFPVVKGKNEHIPEVVDCFQYIDEAIKFAKDLGLNIIRGEVFYNPYIQNDLNLEQDNVELKLVEPVGDIQGKPVQRARLEASSMCQLKCVLCPTGTGKNRKGVVGWGYLKFQDFKKFVDENPQIKEIELSNWGEMFLNPDLKKIISYAYHNNVSLNTLNGVNLNSISEDMIKCLVKYKFKTLYVSIDGATNKTYQIYRKGGNLDKVLRNVKRINYYKKKYNSEFPKLVWRFMVFGHNEHELSLAKKIAKELNMEFMAKFNSFNPSYSPVKNKEIVKKVIGQDVISMEESLQKGDLSLFLGGMNLNSDKPSGASVPIPCIQLWENPQINWDGKFLGCCSNIFSDFGNVFEMGLEKCKQSEKYVYAKKMLLGEVEKRDDIPCSRCGIYTAQSPSISLALKKFIEKLDNKTTNLIPTSTTNIPQSKFPLQTSFLDCIALYLTKKCNQDCIFCDKRYIDEKTPSKESIKGIIDKLKSIKINNLI